VFNEDIEFSNLVVLCRSLCSGVKIKNACPSSIDRGKSTAVGVSGGYGASARELAVLGSRLSRGSAIIRSPHMAESSV